MSFDVCMVVHDDALHDSRIWREARALNAAGWQVVVVCIALGNSQLPDVQVVDGFTIWRVSPRVFRNRQTIKTTRKLIQLVLALPVVLQRIRQSNARVFHAHDFTGLVMMALAGIWRRPLIYDSHELFFDRPFKGLPRWIIGLLMALRPLEKILAQRAVYIIATSEGHAAGMVGNLDIIMPTLVRNAVDLDRVGPVAATYDLPVKYQLAHTGNMFPTRFVVQQVEALAHLPADVGIVFMGQGPLWDAIIQRAVELGVEDRVQMIRPVPVDSVASTLAQADVAMVLINTEAPNDNLAVPNKFYEAVAAGLPMVIQPIPEVAKLVARYDIGVSCDANDPESIAAAVRDILEPDHYARYKANMEKARADINWAIEQQKLISIYRDILK